MVAIWCVLPVRPQKCPKHCFSQGVGKGGGGRINYQAHATRFGQPVSEVWLKACLPILTTIYLGYSCSYFEYLGFSLQSQSDKLHKMYLANCLCCKTFIMSWT